MQELFEPNYGTGFRDCFTRYGMPLETIEGRHVNGWFYFRVVPAGAPDTGKAPPPAAVLKVLARVVPELRRRRRTAEVSMAEVRWLADTRAWAGERGEWIARTDDLLSVDLSAIDDGALVAQVEAALTLSGEMIRRHFSLVGISVAVGRLIVAGQRWGFGPADIVPALRGNSPASSASRAPLVELAALAAEREDVRTVDDLRSLSPRASRLVDGYLSSFGWRPLATDVEAITLAEQPDRLVDLVRAQAARHAERHTRRRLRRPPPAGTGRRSRRVRPPRRRGPRVLRRARRQFRHRRLDVRGGAPDAARGGPASTGPWCPHPLRRRVQPDTIRAARARRRRFAGVGAVAGRAPGPAGPCGARPAAGGDRWRPRRASRSVGVPGALGELAAAVGAYLDQKFTARPDAAAPTERAGALTVDGHASVVGVPVVAGAVVGRIVVSRDPADALERIEPGDILVCPYTTAAHNAIFPMLGGVLTQFGGPLGHTAVMAREFDIPAVVGTGSLPLHLDGQHGRLAACLR